MIKQMLSIIPLVIVGCASNVVEMSQTKRTPVTLIGPDGKPMISQIEDTTTTLVKTKTLWDGKETIEKQRVSNGKTQSVGQSGIEVESSGTNVVGGINAAGELLGNAAKAFLK